MCGRRDLKGHTVVDPYLITWNALQKVTQKQMRSYLFPVATLGSSRIHPFPKTGNLIELI